ncbi:MAG: hypothetical protein JNK85_27295 [Verrucomicrobiales bacterium]|nr:hypothetical protein [Verrucomicrobiales bacterium]
MKVLFSEFAPDYGQYRYPYVVWGCLEPGEMPADLYGAGFHPACPNLERFTLCRHLRVPLPGWRPSSENRRILRKGAGLEVELVPRSAFQYSDAHRQRWLAFADERFGPGIMGPARLDGLMAGRVVSHVLVCRDMGDAGREVGAVLLYVEPGRMAHYYYAFYDLRHPIRSLGMYLMTKAVAEFQAAGFGHLYLGTCYSKKALYKLQFDGLEFFNGLTWTTDLDQLRFLVERDPQSGHLLEDPGFLDRVGGVAGVMGGGRFRLQFATNSSPTVH